MNAHFAGRAVGTALLTSFCLAAHESPFGYVYNSETTPKGELEVSDWSTFGLGKQSGDFLAWQNSVNLEYGWTERFSTELYFKTLYQNIQDAEGSTEMFENVSRFAFQGLEGEFKYQFLTPRDDGFGLALVLEPEWSRYSVSSGERVTEVAAEFRVVFEKRFLDDKLITCLNLIPELEWEQEPGNEAWDKSLWLTAMAGASYRVSRHWWLGVESKFLSEFAERELSQPKTYAWFVGPCAHYQRGPWWATLSVLPQVLGWPDQQGTAGRTYDDFEKVELRFKAGRDF